MSSDAPDAGAASAYAAAPARPACPPARSPATRSDRSARAASPPFPGLVLTYYLTDSLGVAALAAGAVITTAKIWDVVIDPVIGALTDRDLARHGTRRRLMLIGACSHRRALRADLRRAAGLGPVVGAIWVLIAFLLTATAFSLFQVPYIALPAELTASYDERTRLLTWRVVVLTFSILLFGAGGPALRGVTGDPTTGYLRHGHRLGRRDRDRDAGRHDASRGDPSTADAARPLRAATRAAAGREPTRVAGSASTTPAGIRALRARSAARSAPCCRRSCCRRSRPVSCSPARSTSRRGCCDSEDAVQLLFVALIAPALFAAPGWGWVVAAPRQGALLRDRERDLRARRAVDRRGAVGARRLDLRAGRRSPASPTPGMQSLPMAMLPDVISHDERTARPGSRGRVQRRVDRGRDDRLRARRDHAHDRSSP